MTTLSTGFLFNCVTTNGAAKCWGDNNHGQLGNGTKERSATPTRVIGLENVVQISAGAFHACAVLADHTARCWGNNGAGRLGDGTVTSSTTPVVVRGL